MNPKEPMIASAREVLRSITPVHQAWKYFKERHDRRKWRDADVLIVSFPKCGRTWLRVILARVIMERYGKEDLNLQIEEYAENDSEVPNIFFTHERTSSSNPRQYERWTRKLNRIYRGRKVIFLVRDPRDTVISWFHHRKRRTRMETRDISTAIRDENVGIHRVIHWMNLVVETMPKCERSLLVGYEDMNKDTDHELRRILEFCGIDNVGESTRHAAVEFAAFENMRAMEMKSPDLYFQTASLSDPNSFKVRQGKIGSYLKELSKEDIRYVDEQMASLHRSYGLGALDHDCPDR